MDGMALCSLAWRDRRDRQPGRQACKQAGRETGGEIGIPTDIVCSHKCVVAGQMDGVSHFTRDRKGGHIATSPPLAGIVSSFERFNLNAQGAKNSA